MKEILGRAKTIRELLSDAKYSVDFYQREYKWETKQVIELVQDLSTRFIEDYDDGHERAEVENYGHYFLGSIILSKKKNLNFIVDGQQRLTTLTLLLIHLHNLQDERSDLERLIYSEKYSKKSFNIDVDERNTCMEALFNDDYFDPTDQPESVKNIIARFETIRDSFPEEIDGDAVPFFIDWLIDNVHLVEITAYSDEDAYTIFETMNDRGLSLAPVEMLKGYLLANIFEDTKKYECNRLWKKRIQELNEFDKDEDANFFKTWLRSQYANKIRERKKDAIPEDYDLIGTEFHRWVRDNRTDVGLSRSEAFINFIKHDFDFYSRQYLKIYKASIDLLPGHEHIYYNNQNGFTLQDQLLLSPLTTEDSEEIIATKIRIVSKFVDILLARRLWNFHTTSYSTMQYAMFLVMRDIRGKEPEELVRILRERLDADDEDFKTNERFALHQQNSRFIRRIVARITDFIETGSEMPSRFREYIGDTGNKQYEIEHIWADHHEEHKDEFSHPEDFGSYRNHIGGLLLLPKSFNASYSDLPYSKKLKHYLTQNLLAKSLHPQCYEHNPGFLRFIEETGLPFRAYSEFNKAQMDERQELYRLIAEMIWRPEILNMELDGSSTRNNSS